MTRASLQSKLDELILLLRTYLLMKIMRVSLQSKLDELMSLSTHVSIDENNASIIAVEAGSTDVIVYAYFAMKITRVSLQSKLDELIQLLLTLTREIRVDNDISSSSFDCSETRVIFIAEYA